MAVVVHLVERTASRGENNLRDGIRMVLLAVENTVDTTPALIMARAVTVLRARGVDLPDGYFNATRLVSTTFNVAGEHAVWNGSKIHEVA